MDDKVLAEMFRTTVAMLQQRGLLSVRRVTKDGVLLMIRVVLPLDKWNEDLRLK